MKRNRCPYCNEILVANRCDRCNYIKPFSVLKNRIRAFIMGLIICTIAYLILAIL